MGYESQIEDGSVPQQQGFTLVEVVIAMAIAIPVFAGIALTTTSVNDTIEANTRNADVAAYGSQVMREVGGLVLGVQHSSVRTPAVPADVAATRAAKVGDWIQPTDWIWRPGIEFDVLEKLQALNSEQRVSHRRVVFLMDLAEVDNDKDDDGDGLVDEGEVLLVRDGIRESTIRDVEELGVLLDGRVLRLRLGVAQSTSNGRTVRTTIEKRIFIRNN